MARSDHELSLVVSRGATELDNDAGVVIVVDCFSLPYSVNLATLLSNPLSSGTFIRKWLLDRRQLAGTRIVGQRSSSTSEAIPGPYWSSRGYSYELGAVARSVPSPRTGLNSI